ncbi:MAG: RteC domain-containing protein [Ferruginibacter sp.]
MSYHFNTTEDEIIFFKITKPKFHCHLLFYLKVYNIELNRPTASKSDHSEYLSKEFYKLRLFFESHTAFYHYYRSGETFLDDQYFVRHNNARQISGVQFLYIDADPNFSTVYDYQVSKILANQLLSDYLNDELSAIELNTEMEPTAIKPVLAWSDSKVALAELLYALYASGIFNNTQADIKTISAYFCGMFNVKIGNIYKVFEEIRLRRKNRTAFLDTLKQNLIQRMDRDDEQAF